MMSRKVQKRAVREDEETIDCPESEENITLNEQVSIDWTKLPEWAIIHIFSCLSHRERANFSSTCSKMRSLSKSSCLWEELDLRFHNCGPTAAKSLASRCEELKKIRFSDGGIESIHAIANLEARNLREISGEQCQNMSDATLSWLVALHKELEFIHISLAFSERVSCDSVHAIAMCCRKLQRLWLSGIRTVGADAIIALARNCPKLTDVGFIDCQEVDLAALGNVASVCFLSIGGTENINWTLFPQLCSRLPNLIALDISRTNITPSAVTKLFSSSLRVKVVCALNCQLLEDDPIFTTNNNHRGKVLLAVFTDIFKGVATLLGDTPHHENAFIYRRNSRARGGRVDEILNWLEWVISDSLIHVAENNPSVWDNFWPNQGTKLLLSFMQSPQEEIQERAVTALAASCYLDDETECIDTQIADAVVRDGAIRLLLNLAQSWREGLQLVATKAIASLSCKNDVAKAVIRERGLSTLVNLLMSMNILVAEEAVRGLGNLSSLQGYKVAITEAGVKVLVDLMFKRSGSSTTENMLHRAVGVLANLARDEDCSVEIVSAGGIGALVSLAQSYKDETMQEQVCWALSNLAFHTERNGKIREIGQDAGVLEVLIQLTSSHDESVRGQAADALWNLSSDERNQEAIAAAGGVEALVALVRSVTNKSRDLQMAAAGALWRLCTSEANITVIGQEGGVEPLITLAQSYAEDVQETAAGALWNLAADPWNAIHIIELEGVPVLTHLCSFSFSKLASFLSMLALSHVFEGSINAIVPGSVDMDGLRRTTLKHIEGFMMSSSDHRIIASAASSSSEDTTLVQVAKSAFICETQSIKCSRNELKWILAMLRNRYPTLKKCAAFALLQFTFSGSRHALEHTRLLVDIGALEKLAEASTRDGLSHYGVLIRAVLHNLELQGFKN